MAIKIQNKKVPFLDPNTTCFNTVQCSNDLKAFQNTKSVICTNSRPRFWRLLYVLYHQLRHCGLICDTIEEHKLNLFAFYTIIGYLVCEPVING